MARTLLLRNAMVLIALSTLSACATNRARFPDYAQMVTKHESVPVVIDLFVYRDIVGQSRGYNKEANAAYLHDASAQIERSLSQRGFPMNLLAGLSGLTFDVDKDVDYVVSEDWRSTGEAYKKPDLDQTENPWLTKSNKQLLSSLVAVSKEINSSKDKDQVYAQKKVIEESKKAGHEVPIAIDQIDLDSALFESAESNVILFVKVDGRFQKPGKSLINAV